MAEPKLLKVYFYHDTTPGEYSPSEEDLKKAEVFTAVPEERSDINDYNAATTTKQFFSTKVHAVYEGGHTLNVWTDVNSEGDKSWMAFSDYCNLGEMLNDYAYDHL